MMWPPTNGPTLRSRTELGDHMGLTVHGALFSDAYATVVPPADLCFARCDSDSSGSFHLSTSAKLAKFTLRKFDETSNQGPRGTGSGVNRSRRLPLTPPQDTRTGQPGTQRAWPPRTPRASARPKLFISFTNVSQVSIRSSDETAHSIAKKPLRVAHGRQSGGDA